MFFQELVKYVPTHRLVDPLAMRFEGDHRGVQPTILAYHWLRE
jgi:hypothetical protein